MSTPQVLPKSNVIEFLKYRAQRSRLYKNKTISVMTTTLYFMTDTQRKLYEDVPFIHAKIQPKSNLPFIE